MPDPQSLSVGDRVRFLSLPEEWSTPGYSVHSESIELMNVLIQRRRPCRINRVEHGLPWIEARIKDEDGALVYHSWGISETTGWVRVPS